jgi:hypothetical protein
MAASGTRFTLPWSACLCGRTLPAAPDAPSARSCSPRRESRGFAPVDSPTHASAPPEGTLTFTLTARYDKLDIA